MKTKGVTGETIFFDGEPDDASPDSEIEDSNIFADGDQSKDGHRPPPGRKVRLRKIVGQNAKGRFPMHFSGREQHPPEAGKHYRISIGESKVFSSSPVTRVYIQTKNSLYSIEYLEE